VKVGQSEEWALFKGNVVTTEYGEEFWDLILVEVTEERRNYTIIDFIVTSQNDVNDVLYCIVLS
jgi:hypothetical protein